MWNESRIVLASVVSLLLVLQIGILGIGAQQRSVPEAYAQQPPPFISPPIPGIPVEIDLSQIQRTEAAGPEDPIGEPPEVEEGDEIGAPAGVVSGVVAAPVQASTNQNLIAAFTTSWKTITNYLSPKPQLVFAQGSFSTPNVNFDGVPGTFVPGFGFVPYPPDTNGDVGPNHYIQTVNSEFAIFAKDGTLLAGPLFLDTIYAAALPPTDPCALNTGFDPVVIYDHLADRWVMTHVGGPFTNQCFAVSMTGDPVAGGWTVYSFPTMGVVNDYPHLGLWPDAYYMGTNAGDPSGHAWAFDRANMLLGLPATYIRFPLAGTLPQFMLPSDLDGAAPAPGAANVFMRFIDDARFGGVDRIELREFHADFVTPALSTFTPLPDVPTTLPIDSSLCGLTFFGPCVPQPGVPDLLETLPVWPMYKLQYRNFGAYETIVVNHSVDANGADLAGIHWYELRKVGGAWSIFQEGVHSPDSSLHRWMGSVAMDSAGNMALGYSVGSSTESPGIRYAGRLSSDPAGAMPQGEGIILAGTASQAFFRWGDYSSMSVDPVDGCTFWFTTLYFSGATSQWATRIAAFKFPQCGEIIVGGEVMPVDSAAMLVAGASANSVWILPTLAGIAGAAILTAVRIRRRKTSN